MMSTENVSPSKYLEVSIPPDYEHSFPSPRTESLSLSSKMKKMLSSPKVSRGKAVVTPNKTFGVPLEFLNDRDKTDVPLIVVRICEYLQSHGLHHEGLFRVNGNIKVVERLKTSFDKCGDADLEEVGDVPASASLLKMFLRELTEAVIPDDLQPLFITVQDQYSKEKEKAVPLVKELIKRMPRLNSCLLKYLCEFIRRISEESDVNKMNLLALAIVFGPNIFRCGDGLEGLREQAYVNAVLLLMLEEYEEIFLINNEIFPDSTTKAVPQKPTPYIEHMKMKKENKENKDKPARPPPPQISLDAELVETSPKNSPRSATHQKRSSKRKSPKSASKSELQENKVQSPKKRTPSKKEPTRSLSPTHTTFSSPLSKHLVDNTITTAVKEHIFGPGLVTSSVESDIFDDMPPLQTSEVAYMSVKDRIQKLSSEHHEEQPYKKIKGSDKAQVPTSKSTLKLPLQQDAHANLTDDDLDYLQGTSSATLEPLTSDRADPPKNRKKPSPATRSTRSSSYKEAKSNSIYDSDEFFRSKDGEHPTDSSSSSLSEKTANRQLRKSQSVPLGDNADVAKSANAVPFLELDCSQEQKEEAQKSSREKYNMMLNESPVRSPHNSAPSSPRTTEKRHEFWEEKRQDTVPIVDMTPKELRKRIASLKKIIINFENNFEDVNGRKAKSSDKVDIQKYIAELGRAKKQLKELLSDYKENPELLSETAPLGPDFGTAPNLREPLVSTDSSSKEQTLKSLLKKLEDKRLAAGRPHEILVMNIDQLKDEKLAVQKVLLQYENLHGRPNSKEDKTLMRPLYDRYRKIKRRIATGKVESPSKQSVVSNIHDTDGSPVKEEESKREHYNMTNDSRVLLHEKTTENARLHDDEAAAEENYAENQTLGDTFSVTRHIRDADTPEPFSPRDSSPRSIDEAVLHDATISELLEQQRDTKRTKKKLGKLLKDFEDEFLNTWNRKMQKEDRLPREAEYREYKMVKAKLRLVEALIAKKSGNNTV